MSIKIGLFCRAKGKIPNLGLPYARGGVLPFHRLGYDPGGFPRFIPFGYGLPLADRGYSQSIALGARGYIISGYIVI